MRQRNDEKFTLKEQEDFCKTCSLWILLRVTLMGAKIYGCWVGLKPRVSGKKLACRYRKKTDKK